MRYGAAKYWRDVIKLQYFITSIQKALTKNKLQKFNEVATFPNVYQNYNPKEPKLIDHKGEVTDLKGQWRQRYFKNTAPLILELACGRGEYTLGLAQRYPTTNFIGVDVKGARIWKGAKFALTQGLTNVAFLRTRIEQLQVFVAPQEVDEIWITFPDPFLKKERRRLTAPRFLHLYRQILKPTGIVHLKTDDPTLYEFTLETLATENCPILYHHHDIYANALFHPDLELKTYYEQMHLANSKTIKYVQFRVSNI